MSAVKILAKDLLNISLPRATSSFHLMTNRVTKATKLFQMSR
jgi:hypothetical protein